MEFTGILFLVISFLTLTFATAPPEPNKAPPAITKWQALMPAIANLLTRKGNPCPDEELRGGPVDAAEFSGSSFALVDVCPSGAYTELIVAMRLDAGQPVFTRFRKANREIDLGFARGSSVMHGKDVKLIPEQRAIYDISWDDNG